MKAEIVRGSACRRCHGDGYESCVCAVEVPDAYAWEGLSAIERAEVLADELAAALPAAVREAEASKDDRLTMLLAAVAGSVAALRCGLAERRSS